jgi:hypothetical protein
VTTPDGTVEVKPYQIIVLVSVTPEDLRELPHDAPRIPVVLDTGHNHNFAIRRAQFERWVQLVLPRIGQIEVCGSIIPLVTANLWIHPNREGTIEASEASPLMLELKEGVATYPPIVSNPARLPTLGLRAIIRNGLKLTIDGEAREVTMESPLLERPPILAAPTDANPDSQSESA